MLDHQLGKFRGKLMTSTSISDDDELDVKYLFRTFDEMPSIEQKAIELSRGTVLDVGCGSGCHALELQARDLSVTAIDISPNAVETARLRGVRNAAVADIMQMDGRFDTILLLMNGTGICGKIDKLPDFLLKLKSLMAPGGQILIDSSDIIYMFEEKDGSYRIPAEGFYGELIFYLSYKGIEEVPFPWLYVPFDLMQQYAGACGLICEKVIDGTHYDYLARLSVK